MQNNSTKLFFAALLFLSSSIFSQGFIWMKGPSTTSASGIYGQVGVQNVGNNPGARWGASSWKSANGDFWLFGGYGNDFIGNTGYLNDVWKYTMSNNTWTWIKGDQTIAQIGNYGALGVASNSNKPGCRSNACTWQDANGNVYLFGGKGYDGFGNLNTMNDLWKYNPSTNQWTWIKGSNTILQTATYGTLGISNSSNTPGSREGACRWIDATGNLWLFGGVGVTTNSLISGVLNDLWKYNITANEWTWMNGNNTLNTNGSFGTITVTSSSNTPSARVYASTWVDQTGNLYMFGGKGFDAIITSTALAYSNFLNDLWKFDVSTNQWTWMKGNNTGNQIATIGTQGVASVSNNPGSRSESITWKDSYNNLWLASGYGYSAVNSGALSDVWLYQPSTNNWMWVAGAGNSNFPAVYGNTNTPNPTNIYGARNGAVSWIDANDNLWFFGGYGYTQGTTQGQLSDLWKYTNCVNNPISMTITTSNPLPCAKETITLSVTGANTYTWNTGQTTPFITLNLTSTAGYSASTSNTNACIYTTGFTQSVSACVGLNKNEDNATEILIYPNPSSGKIYFKNLDSKTMELKIYDISGRLVKLIVALDTQTELSLEKGIYFYSVFKDYEKIKSGKIVFY